MLQEDEPEDFVIAMGETHSITEFASWRLAKSVSTIAITSRSTNVSSAQPRSIY